MKYELQSKYLKTVTPFLTDMVEPPTIKQAWTKI